MARQPDLNLPTPDQDPPSLLVLVNELLRVNGPRKKSVLAEQLGCSESHLSEVLSGQKHLPEPWLKFIAKNYDPEKRVSAYVRSWQGARHISDAAWRRASDRVLARHNGLGAELRREIEAEALAEPETDEAAK